MPTKTVPQLVELVQDLTDTSALSGQTISSLTSSRIIEYLNSGMQSLDSIIREHSLEDTISSITVTSNPASRILPANLFDIVQAYYFSNDTPVFLVFDRNTISNPAGVETPVSYKMRNGEIVFFPTVNTNINITLEFTVQNRELVETVTNANTQRNSVTYPDDWHMFLVYFAAEHILTKEDAGFQYEKMKDLKDSLMRRIIADCTKHQRANPSVQMTREENGLNIYAYTLPEFR